MTGPGKFLVIVALTAGISGCHLLCKGFSCSHGLFVKSTEMRGVGVLGGIVVLDGGPAT